MMRASRDGFSLIEIIFGMLIFVTGVLALGASTGFVGMQLQAADLRTERSIAHMMASERLYATHFDSVKDRTQSSAITIGAYDVWWNVESLDWALKEVEVISSGPGVERGQRESATQDTVVFRMARLIK